MKLSTHAWLTAARIRGRRGVDFPARRRDLVRRLAPGRSFIDVGGMWNIDGEMAFLAEEAGADRVALLDAMPASERFESEHKRRGSSVAYVQADLHDRDAIGALGSFDVVWCTGVVYHSPSPYEQVEQLRRLTGWRLLLGSHVIPELPVEGACVWYPALSEGSRRAFRRAHRDRAGIRRVGLTEPFDPAPEQRYANYWWGITPSALRAMLSAAGLRVIEEHRQTTFLLDLLAAPEAPG